MLFYDINTEPYSIKSISLINFPGNEDDVGSHKNTRKSNLVTGGVTTQPEMYTEDRSHTGYPHVFTSSPTDSPVNFIILTQSRTKYDEIKAATVREIMRIRPNMQ